MIKRAKDVDTHSLTYDLFLNLLNRKNVDPSKKNTIRDYTKGSVSITNKNVILNADAYIKRSKLYDDKGLWVNTQPNIINTIDLSFIVYKKPSLDLIINSYYLNKEGTRLNNTYIVSFKDIMIYPLIGFFRVLYILGKALLEEGGGIQDSVIEDSIIDSIIDKTDKQT